MNAPDPSPSSSPPPSRRWTFAALAAPFVGFVLGLLVFPRHEMAWGLAASGPFLFGAGGGSLLGLLLVAVALARREPRGLILVALLVSLPLATLLAALLLF